MVDLRTLGIVIDALQDSAASLLGARPAAPIARAQATQRVAQEASRAGPPLVPDDELVAEDGTGRSSQHASIDARSGTAAVGGHPVASNGRASYTSAQSPSASLELSATAQWLQRALATEPARQAGTIHAAAPLAPHGAVDARTLAHALRESVAESGLFYESHLAEWTMQRYPEAELRREPQAGWLASIAHDSVPPAANGAATPMLAQPVAVETNAQSGELMRAQLQVLESRQLTWQGETWPGQHASITLEEESPADRDAPPTWRTHVRLELPELGEIDVDILLVGDALRITMDAAEHGVEHLTRARAELAAALEAHANATASIVIRPS